MAPFEEDLSFSGHVLGLIKECCDSVEESGHSPSEKAEAVEFQALARTVRNLLESKEWFVKHETDDHLLFAGAGTGGLVQDLLDEHFTRDLLARVPEIVRRAIRLSAINPTRLPQNTANLYLREASRCYIMGLWHASGAMSRAALETALRENVVANNGWAPRHLSDVIARSRQMGILDGPTGSLANRVKQIGDQILHSRTTSVHEIEEALTATRTVLAYLYNAALQ